MAEVMALDFGPDAYPRPPASCDWTNQAPVRRGNTIYLGYAEPTLADIETQPQGSVNHSLGPPAVERVGGE